MTRIFSLFEETDTHSFLTTFGLTRFFSFFEETDTHLFPDFFDLWSDFLIQLLTSIDLARFGEIFLKTFIHIQHKSHLVLKETDTRRFDELFIHQ